MVRLAVATVCCWHPANRDDLVFPASWVTVCWIIGRWLGRAEDIALLDMVLGGVAWSVALRL